MAKATNLAGVKTKTLNYDHTAAVADRDIILLGGRVLIAVGDKAANESGPYYHASQRIEAAKAAVTIEAGETAYWDNSAEVFTNVVGTNTKCGMFVEDAAPGDANAVLELDNSVNY